MFIRFVWFILILLHGFIYRFKLKYNPEECEKRNREVKKALQHRCNVFMDLMESGRVEATWVDFEKSDELVKLLDAGMNGKVC